jgi:arylsulfatase A
MKKIYLTILLILLSFLVSLAQKDNDLMRDKKTNIVLMMADDMGYEVLGINGSTEYSTPELDRIAEKGMRFTQCYSQPLCTPSRVKIMTGKYNFRNYEGFGYLNEKQRTFGNIMQDAGYKTCIVGKWQLNGLSTNIPGCLDSLRPKRMGFDEFALWQVDKKGSRYANPCINTNGITKEYGIDKYGPDIFSDYAVDFIRRNKDNPFFLYYPMVLTHSPFVPTPDSPEWLDENLRDKSDTSFYADMVKYTDKIVEKIQQALLDNDIYENTIFIFIADNGTHPTILSTTKNRVVQGGKGKTISDGTHVPFILNWPTFLKKSAVYSNIISFADFFPTFANLVGENCITDGRSFLPLLCSTNETKSQDNILIYYDPMWNKRVNRNRGYFAQTTTYKLYHNKKFYNIRNDILEKHPLLFDDLSPEEQKIYKELELELKKVPYWDEKGRAVPNISNEEE